MGEFSELTIDELNYRVNKVRQRIGENTDNAERARMSDAEAEDSYFGMRQRELFRYLDSLNFEKHKRELMGIKK